MLDILKNIWQLEEEFESMKGSSDSNFIKFYEDNLITINRLDEKLGGKNEELKIKIGSDYGISLISEGFKQKGLPYVEKSIKLLEKIAKEDNKDLREVQLYQHLLWYNAKTNFELGRYDESLQLFNSLIKMNTENKAFKAWKLSIYQIKSKKWVYLLLIVLIIIFLTEVIFAKVFEKEYEFMSIINYSLIIIFTINQLYFYIMKKRYEN